VALILAGASNNREFVALLEATENEHGEMIFATNTKWLIRGSV
jgi:hypothetical protein